MKKLVLLFLATAVFTVMTMTFVWAGDDYNPYVIVKSPLITVEHK